MEQQELFSDPQEPKQFDEYGDPIDLKDSERPLYEMFTECTGRVPVDSGGAHGRAWQRNRLRDLRKDPHAEIELYVGGRRFEYVAVSTYHFLESKVDFNEEMNALYNKWRRRKAIEELPLCRQMEAFPEWLARMLPNVQMRGPFDSTGRGDHSYVYTYNEGNVLNQDFHFVAFEYNYEEYYLISLHGGADARWGFTDAKVFKGNGCSEWAVFDYHRATIGCAEGHNWDTDDAYKYRSDECEPKEFGDIRIVLAKDHSEYDKEKDSFKRSERVILVDKDGVMHCPVKGCGKPLAAYPFP